MPTDRRDAGSGRRVGGARRGPPVDAAPAPRPTALRVGPRLRQNLPSRSRLPRRSSRQVPPWVSTVARPDNTSVGTSGPVDGPGRPAARSTFGTGPEPRVPSASRFSVGSRSTGASAGDGGVPSGGSGPFGRGTPRRDAGAGPGRPAAQAARAARASARALPAMVGPTRWPWRWGGSTRRSLAQATAALRVTSTSLAAGRSCIAWWSATPRAGLRPGRTDRRLLVVADRPGRPLVESLHPTRRWWEFQDADDGRSPSWFRRPSRHAPGRVHEVEAELLVGPDRSGPTYL